AAADEIVVAFYQTGHETGDISPLTDGIFEQDLFAKDLAGVAGSHFYLRVYDRDVQRRRRDGYDIEGEDAAYEGDTAIDAGGDVVGMFYAGGHFFAKEGEPDEVFFSEAVVQEVVGGDDRACGAGGTGAAAGAGFD